MNKDLNQNKLEEVLLKAGTIVKIEGFPFYIKSDNTVVLGRIVNFELALKLAEENKTQTFKIEENLKDISE